MRRRAFVPGSSVLLFVVLLAAQSSAQDSHQFESTLPVPFELVSGFLVVVNGQVGDLHGLRFVLDTGTTTTVIDRKIADRLGLRRRAGTVTNFDRPSAVEWAEIPELRVGPMRVGTTAVMVANLTDYSTFAENIDGILGLDLLTKIKKLTIDYDTGMLSFLLDDQAARDHSPSHCLIVRLLVQGRPLRLVLDTGIQGIVLYGRTLHGLSNFRTEGETSDATMGRTRGKQIKLPGVRIGHAEIVATVFVVDDSGHDLPPGVDGYIGPAVLQAKRIELDFAASTLRWR